MLPGCGSAGRDVVGNGDGDVPHIFTVAPKRLARDGDYAAAMALEVGIVGLPNSGKTTLFNALTRAGAEITAYASVTDKPNVGMATIADDRLGRLAALVEAKKVTPAAVRVVDVPGTGPQLLGNLRQVDAILAVLDGFSSDATPADDLETLKLELLVADRDHVERRHERVAKEAKSGDPAKRTELETLTALLAHLDSGRTLADWPGELPPELDPLTTKPLLAVENGPGASTASSRRSSPSSTTRRPESSATGPLRSTRSCAGCRRRSA